MSTNKKTIIKLNESQLLSIIKESVCNILNENIDGNIPPFEESKQYYSIMNALQRIMAITQDYYNKIKQEIVPQIFHIIQNKYSQFIDLSTIANSFDRDTLIIDGKCITQSWADLSEEEFENIVNEFINDISSIKWELGRIECQIDENLFNIGITIPWNEDNTVNGLYALFYGRY